MARGRVSRPMSRMPRAIAPEVTSTTFSPSACRISTCPHTQSRTSARSEPSSPATIEEPSFATTVPEGVAPPLDVEALIPRRAVHRVLELEAALRGRRGPGHLGRDPGEERRPELVEARARRGGDRQDPVDAGAPGGQRLVEVV